MVGPERVFRESRSLVNTGKLNGIADVKNLRTAAPA
jgi:hypothetical protein